ncbi:TonB-dependent siderophore receptor [Pseudoduganella plicata]|uniref:TonB-dependent siderophore receptor n=1 Tax=Pseudoduganella plicata TaxID=321984 RepID=A0ABX5S369_9BURK|nr:TonB-dependent siderophore receptor [Pseudoduganella plicata]QBQ34758.1 TonB-dependent siderophore receptor [Pseudoduganella plicata]
MRLIDIPQSVTVFTEQRMRDQNLFTLGDLMQQAPGVSVMPFDGANPDFRSRGYSLEQAYDGIPAASPGSGTQEFELAIYERVELLRGPAGVTQGAGQPGGIINFVRKRGSREARLSAAASAGSHSNRRIEIDAGAPLNAAGTLRGRAVGTFQERDYFHDVTHDRKWLGYLALDADLDSATVLSLAFARQVDNLRSPSMGLPAYLDGRFLDVSRSLHVYPSWNRFFWATNESSAELSRQLGDGWEVRARAVHRTVDKFYKDAYPSTGVNPATMRATYARRAAALDFQRTGADLYASGPVKLFGRSHALVIGYNWEQRLASNRNVTYSAVPNVSIFQPETVAEPDGDFARGNDNRVTQSGLYTQARLSLADPLTLALGARVTRYRSESRAIAPSPVTPFVTGAMERGEVTPSVALLWHLAAGINAYVSYADIFFPQALFDAAGQVLDPRVGKQVELGAKGNFLDGRLNASAAMFRSRDRNRALYTGVGDIYTAAGTVEVRGVEFEVGGRPLPELNLSAGYTWLSTEYGVHPTLEGSQFSTFEPKHSVKLYARWQPGWMRGLFVGGGVTANSALLGSGVPGLREQGGYAVANVQAGYTFARGVTMSVAVNNLFDRTYWARVGGLNTYNTYADPRSVLLSVRGSY